MTSTQAQTESPTTTEDQTRIATTGRALVRSALIAPLERDGMLRDRRTKASEHAAFLEKLAERLGYMTPENIECLRQLIMALATGPARNVWPGWVTIRNHAYAMQTPPDPENPIMQTWLHSRRGPMLRDQGGLVETYLFLRDKNRPPAPYDERQIEEAARENARKRSRVVEAISRDAATDDDRKWLAWFTRITEICNDIVDAGIAHRRALGERE